MQRVSMALSRIHANARLDLPASSANRRYHSARNSIHARTMPNALIIIHIIRVSVRQAIEAPIAPRILMIAKITCVKMVIKMACLCCYCINCYCEHSLNFIISCDQVVFASMA